MARAYLFAATALALLPQAARAADPAAGAAPARIEEVVVTARKRAEKLFDVPGPVSVVSSRQVEQLRLRSARDYITLIPGAYLDEGDNSGGQQNFSLRGVTTPTIFAEPGVGVYVDDIFSAAFISYPLQLHDIERIEAVRGPQGALYGRDAVGGAINVISRAPDATSTSTLTATYASYNRVELDATTNIAISDKFRVRLAAWGVNQPDGEYTNIRGDRALDATAYAGGRASATWDIAPDWTASFLVEHTQGDTPGTILYFPGLETKDTIRRDTQPQNSIDVTRYNAKLGYASAIGRFDLIFGGREFALTGVEDTDLSDIFAPNFGAGFLGRQVTKRRNSVSDKSAELRYTSAQFGPLSLLAGFVFIDGDASGGIVSDLDGITTTLGIPSRLTIQNSQTLRSYAGYAEATLRLGADVKFIVDARYTNDDKADDFSYVRSGVVPPPDQFANPRKTFTRFTPGGTLAWEPAPDWRLYAKALTGFRAGGYNFNVGSARNLPYNQETSENYEIGAKHSFAAAAAYLALTGYVLRQHNILLAAFDASQPGPVGSYLVNAGEARTLGFDVEGSATPLPGLTVTGSVGYQDAVFTGGLNPLGGDKLDGRGVPSARRWTTATTILYRRPITDTVDGFVNASYSYRSSAPSTLGTATFTPPVYDAANLLNFSVGVAFGRYEIRSFVQNLLDSDYKVAFGGFRDGITGIIRAQGRTAGVTLNARF